MLAPVSHPRALVAQPTTRFSAPVMLSPASSVAGAAAALVLFRLATRWEPRMNVLLNIIFLFVSPPKFTAVTDEADPAMVSHVKMLRETHSKGMVSLPAVSVGATEDLIVPRDSAGEGGIPVRMYYPSTTTDDSPLPWLLYCHGGGWVMGSVDTHDAFCRRLCADAGVAVASVNYRRSPEHKFPAAEEDCYEALRSLVSVSAGSSDGLQTLRPLDPNRVAVGGDSSGGTLAAGVAIRAARDSLPLRLQLLLCPALDAAANTPSYEANANAPGLGADTMRWLWDRYLPTGDAEARLAASPMQSADLSGVAPAYLVGAELDVLRDEAEVYAARLRGAGAQATFVSCARTAPYPQSMVAPQPKPVDLNMPRPLHMYPCTRPLHKVAAHVPLQTTPAHLPLHTAPAHGPTRPSHPSDPV